MKKKVLLFIVVATSIFFAIYLTHARKKQDKILVYNVTNQVILETYDKELLAYFSDLIGNSTKNLDETNYDSLLQKVPDDAKVIYRYRFVSKTKQKVDFYVYENYPYLTLKGIPIVSPLTWELSKEDYIKLINPFDYKK